MMSPNELIEFTGSWYAMSRAKKQAKFKAAAREAGHYKKTQAALASTTKTSKAPIRRKKTSAPKSKVTSRWSKAGQKQKMPIVKRAKAIPDKPVDALQKAKHHVKQAMNIAKKHKGKIGIGAGIAAAAYAAHRMRKRSGTTNLEHHKKKLASSSDVANNLLDTMMPGGATVALAAKNRRELRQKTE